MKSSAHILSLSTFVLLLFVVTSSTAMPADDDTDKTGAEASTNSTGSELIGEDDPPTAEETAMQTELDELWGSLCLRLAGDCWLFYKQTKPYLSEEQRHEICYQSTKGFATCDALTAENAQQGAEEAEQRNVERVEAETQKQQKISERKAKLARRKEAMEARLSEMKEAAKDC